MNLIENIRKLVKLFKTEEVVPEVKQRVKLNLKHKEVKAQIWVQGRWSTVKSVDISVVAVDVAIARCQTALSNFSNIVFDEEGVVKP